MLLKVLHLLLKKKKNEIENIFLHDTGNNIKNLSSDSSDTCKLQLLLQKGGIIENKEFIFNRWSNNFFIKNEG